MEPPRPHANLTLSSVLPKAAALSGGKKKIKLLNNLNPISPEIVFARFKSNLTKKKRGGGGRAKNISLVSSQKWHGNWPSNEQGLHKELQQRDETAQDNYCFLKNTLK